LAITQFNSWQYDLTYLSCISVQQKHIVEWSEYELGCREPATILTFVQLLTDVFL